MKQPHKVTENTKGNLINMEDKERCNKGLHVVFGRDYTETEKHTEISGVRNLQSWLNFLKLSKSAKPGRKSACRHIWLKLHTADQLQKSDYEDNQKEKDASLSKEKQNLLKQRQQKTEKNDTHIWSLSLIPGTVLKLLDSLEWRLFSACQWAD